jgi:hypothetical protein
MARLEAVAAWRIRHTAVATHAMLSAALLPWAAVLPSSDGTRKHRDKQRDDSAVGPLVADAYGHAHRW